MSDSRIKQIDFAKGIAIILVVFGHSLAYEDVLKAIIFSFHVPVFFVCSGITMKVGQLNAKKYCI